MKIGITEIIGVAIIGVVVTMMIKKSAPEIALVSQLSIICIMFAFSAGYFFDIVNAIKEISEFGDSQLKYTSVLLKAGGITVTGSLACDVCKDSGENALASFLELVVKAIVLSLSLPIIKLLLQMAFGLLK
ncbi:MAG TPA: stage III sporulation AC/AD family protein [Oscillospiraceae bacterium]|nr:stage III sporulation AC/AD family protein [Oscillospiraceae bacterium]